MNGSLNRKHYLYLLCLVLAVIAVYSQGFNHDFVNFDDTKYVIENPDVRSGLSLKGTVWAFTTTHASNWHPLTWLSHMLDIELFGLSAGWHHMTSLLFHIFNTLLLFFVLQRMTKAFYRSLFVAALFALHPLHVESVAWIAERKDVLSTFFWMLVMYSYVLYVERPLWSRYCFILLFFILGLLSKPMLVTLPFVLLLLDFWPLGRFDKEEGRKLFNFIPSRLIIEKVPLFILAGISCIITFVVQKQGGAIRSLEFLPLNTRIFNSLASYAGYLFKMVWPFNLAVLYPHPHLIPFWKTAGAGLLLLFISVLVLRKMKRFPFLSVGWLWYLGTLVPVIGLVQVGAQSMADRYTYIPFIGVFIMIAWGVPEALERWRDKKTVLTASTITLILFLSVCAWFQVRYWKNGITLFTHTVDVTSNNYLAMTNLGVALMEREGRLDEAIALYQESLRIQPHDEKAHYNMGVALGRKGKHDDAVFHFFEALKIYPDYEKAHYNMGVALGQQGRLKEAIFHFGEALRINPDNPEAHNNLGFALAYIGRYDEAVSHYYQALRINPYLARTHRNLGTLLIKTGKIEDAVYHLREALRINPRDVSAQKILNNILKTIESSQ